MLDAKGQVISRRLLSYQLILQLRLLQARWDRVGISQTTNGFFKFGFIVEVQSVYPVQ